MSPTLAPMSTMLQPAGNNCHNYGGFCVKTTAITVTWLTVCQKQQQPQMWCVLCQNSSSCIVNPNQPHFKIRFRERKLPPRVKDPPSPGEIPLDVHGRQKTPQTYKIHPHQMIAYSCCGSYCQLSEFINNHLIP